MVRILRGEPTPSPTPTFTASGQPDIKTYVGDGQGGGGGNGTGGMVWWGAGPTAEERQRGRVGHAISIEEAYNKLTELSDYEIYALGQRMYRAGLINDPTSFKAIMNGWADMVDSAAAYYNGPSKRELTPWDMLSLQEARQAEMGGPPGGGTGYTGPKSRTFHDKVFNIPSAAEADNITRTMFQNLLGRGPDEAELKRYRSLLVAKAKENPDVVTKQATYDKYGAEVDSVVTKQPGYSQDMGVDLVTQNAKADPEYGAYQASTTYMNALMQAIGL